MVQLTTFRGLLLKILSGSSAPAYIPWEKSYVRQPEPAPLLHWENSINLIAIGRNRVWVRIPLTWMVSNVIECTKELCTENQIMGQSVYWDHSSVVPIYKWLLCIMDRSRWFLSHLAEITCIITKRRLLTGIKRHVPRTVLLRNDICWLGFSHWQSRRTFSMQQDTVLTGRLSTQYLLFAPFT